MLKYEGKPFREFRCRKCRALLAEEYVFFGRLRIKCRKCKTMNSLNFKASKKLLENYIGYSDIEDPENMDISKVPKKKAIT